MSAESVLDNLSEDFDIHSDGYEEGGEPIAIRKSLGSTGEDHLTNGV